MMKGCRSAPFLYFITTYCNTLSCKFWKLALKFSSLVPSTSLTSCTLPLKVFGIPNFFSSSRRFYACLLCCFSLSQFWSYCCYFLRSWTCGPLVSPHPISWMLPLGVSWWGYFFILPFLVRDLWFGEWLDTPFLFIEQGSNWGTCLKFLSTIEALIGYLLRIFVNTLLSHFILL